MHEHNFLSHGHNRCGHAGDYTVLAASPQQLVGVDVMEIRHPNNDVGDFFRLMRPQFTPVEWDDILAPASDIDRLHIFYRYVVSQVRKLCNLQKHNVFGQAMLKTTHVA